MLEASTTPTTMHTLPSSPLVAEPIRPLDRRQVVRFTAPALPVSRLAARLLLARPTGASAPRRSGHGVAVSRRGFDHGWIGLVLLTLALLLIGPRASLIAEAMDDWTPLAVADTVMKTPTDLTYANGAFWATGTTGRVQYSEDRTTWHIVQTPAAGTLRSIIFAQGRYVAVGDKLTILSSTTGTGDWTVHTTDAASTRSYKQVIYADGKFVAVGGRGQAAYSTNGTDWTPVTMPDVDMYCTGVAWGNGLFVAAGELDGYYCIATSPDAVTWTRRYVSVGYGYKAVGFFNGLFIAGNVSELATSPDGVTWTRLTVPFQYANMTIRGIRVLNGRVFTFGNSGLVMSSVDGSEWVTHTTGTTYHIVSLGYDNDRLLLFRSGIVTSGNGPAQSAYWPPVDGGTGGGNNGGTGEEPDEPCIANISTRAWVGSGDSLLISGFVIQGSASKQVLVRAVGPTLANYGVTGTLADPQLRVLSQNGTELAGNNDWGTFADQPALAQAASAVGAFGLGAGSKDAALLITLEPGLYTAQISGVGASTGIALVEVYDVSGGAASKLINISSRGYVGSGANVAIPGFVVSGSGSRTLLIRGIGPRLANYGVSNVLADPNITLVGANQTVLAQNDNWGAVADPAALAAAMASVGAFSLTAGSADAAMLVTVPPGMYTVVVAGANNSTGNALVEVYELP